MKLSVFLNLILLGAIGCANGENDIQSKPYYGIDGLILKVEGDLKHAHRQINVHHRFTRLVHPYKSKHLWWYVQEECKSTWETAKPDDHHTAATVNIHTMKLWCWAGYKDEDVVDWSHHPWDVTFIRDAKALGKAPHAYWHTHKFDTSEHPPKPDPENIKSEL